MRPLKLLAPSHGLLRSRLLSRNDTSSLVVVYLGLWEMLSLC